MHAGRFLLAGKRSALFCVPEREADLLRHYTLSDAGLENINAKRAAPQQVCARR